MTTYTNNTLVLSRAIGLDPQILHEFAENISRQMEAQAAAFAPALQAIQSAPASQAFYPGGLDSYDPERAKRPPLPQDKMPKNGGLGSILGGLLEDMNQKIDGFLQFFKDLAAATAEALNNLYEFGDAIKAFAELAATAAESVSALLQMQPKPEEAPQESEELTARLNRFKGLYKRSPQPYPLSQGQQIPPAQQPLLGSAAQGIQLLIDKFEPILQGIHGLVQQCFTALVLIEMNLITLPAMMPKPEEKGFLTEIQDQLLGVLLEIIIPLVATTLGVTTHMLVIVIAAAIAILYSCEKLISQAVHGTKNDVNDKPFATNEAMPINNIEQNSYTTKLSGSGITAATATPERRFAWPGIVPLSAAAPTPPNTVTNTNYYSNCNNNNNNPDLTIHALMQATTPDALAERIGRELKTLGRAFNYAVQG